MSIEIERKWLVSGFPKGIEIDYIEDSYTIKQSYLIASEEEIRLREATPLLCLPGELPPYMLTFKGPGTFSRKEVEIELTYNQYKSLFNAVEGEPIEKLYYKYFVYGYHVEVSRVDNEWYYAEVEFDNEEEMKKFEFPWPEIVIEEVTCNDFYKMKNYWNRRNSK